MQCSCVESSATGVDTCDYACGKVFPDGATLAKGERFLACMPPPNQTCEGNGVCTATSADVLRQDGIMCGCADVGLKYKIATAGDNPHRLSDQTLQELDAAKKDFSP